MCLTQLFSKFFEAIMKLNKFLNNGLNDIFYLRVFYTPELEKLEKEFIDIFNTLNKSPNPSISEKYIDILNKIYNFADLEEIETFETAYGITIK